jgi:hypothetical protein
MGFFARLAGTAITLSLVAGGYQYLKQHHVVSATFRHESFSTALSNSGSHDDHGAEHFSPAENLERLEGCGGACPGSEKTDRSSTNCPWRGRER